MFLQRGLARYRSSRTFPYRLLLQAFSVTISKLKSLSRVRRCMYRRLGVFKLKRGRGFSNYFVKKRPFVSYMRATSGKDIVVQSKSCD